MLDRATVVDENFTRLVKTGRFPKPRSQISPADAGLSERQLLDLFDSQLSSRHLDLMARILKEKGQSFYTIGSSGHEANCAVAAAFRADDMAFLHYRSGGFMVQRLKMNPSINPLYDIMLSFVAAKADPVCSGRHKVFGSKLQYVPPQTSTIASHLPKAVGTAFSISRAKELGIQGELASDSVVLCSFGDASMNHSTAQGALNTAQWIAYSRFPLPLVFVCEDNGIGISVKTPNNWVEHHARGRTDLHYVEADGLSLADTYHSALQAEMIARKKRQPVFLHLRLERLLGHAGSDIETQYRSSAAIEATEFEDPLLHSARTIIGEGILNPKQVLQRYEEVREKVRHEAEKVVLLPRLSSADDVMASLVPPPNKQPLPAEPDEAARREVFSGQYAQLDMPRNMCQLINLGLTDILLRYPNCVAFGEDVGKKGGVYRVTADLYKKFGSRRVFDSLLDEQTILGLAIGFAHNGFIPIPEIQFLAYLHNAEDQLRGEAATLPFFSNGQFTNPMVLRIASLAYQRGFGGHFHNDNSIAVLRDLPGVIVVCPSNGSDAVKLMRQAMQLAYQQRRVVVFLEPIALYMTKDLHSEGDNQWLQTYPLLSEQIELGEISQWGEGDDCVIVTYGNGYYLSRQAAKILSDQHSLQVRIIDLHWLAPLPETALLCALTSAKHVLIVDECRKSGSVSEAIMTLLMEKLQPLPKVSRLTGHDSFIPLGNAWQYVLPSRDDIVQCCLKGTSARYAP